MDTTSRLMQLLDTQGELNQRQVAGALGVSIRTARRHLKRLCADGLLGARRDGRAKQYSLAPGARAVPAVAAVLTEAEAEALTVAALAARATLAPTPFIQHLDRAAATLRTGWLHEVMSFEPEQEEAVWSFDDTAGPPRSTPGSSARC